MLITGRAIIYGATGTITVGSAALDTANQGVNFTHSFDFKEILNSVGEPQTLVGSGEKFEVDIEFIPSGDNLNEAATMADAGIPDLMSKVVLSDFAVAKYNGDWTYSGGATMTSKNNDALSIKLPLKKYPGDLATPVT